MDLGIKDKVAIVLASSKGLGRGTAMALAQEGCRLAICARGKDALEATAKEIRETTGQPVLAMAIDLQNKEDRKTFIDATIQEYGSIDILITNSGGPPAGTGMALKEEEWQRAADSTLLFAIHWTRTVVPWMQKNKWGRIINIMSISIKQPIPGLILSNTMRAGVAGFAKSMSQELAPYGITVHTVCPGSHRTDRLKSLAERRAKEQGTPVEEQWDKMAAEVPLGRIGDPGEFGQVVAFLASARASYLTGTTIQVDGGTYRGLL